MNSFKTYNTDEKSVIEAIKKHDLFDCDLKKFISSITMILAYRGLSASSFFLNELDGKTLFMTKMSLYDKTSPEIYENSSRGNSPMDTEMEIAKVLKKRLVDTEITPCIVSVYYVKVCQLTTMSADEVSCKMFTVARKERVETEENKAGKKGGEVGVSELRPANRNFRNLESGMDVRNAAGAINRIFCNQKLRVEHGIADDKVSFVVMEMCAMTFGKFIQSYANTYTLYQNVFKSLLFQIIFTLYQIRQEFPDFYHGDLHVGNILLSIADDFEYDHSSPRFLKFTAGRNTWYVPFFGMFVKIIDFGMSYLDEKTHSSFLYDKIFKMNTLQDHHGAGDMIELFRSIYRNGNSDLDSIIDTLDPERNYLENNTWIKHNKIVLPTYHDLLHNQMWDSYTSSQPNKSIYKKYGN